MWGGELLVGDLRGFERAGHLRPVRLPGGDRGGRASRGGWRARGWPRRSATPPATAAARSPAGSTTERWRAVARLARSGLASPVTTSAGRLFDAVAALCGLRAEVTYEGQAAIELEAACDPAERGAYAIPRDGGVLDARPAVLAAAARRRRRRAGRRGRRALPQRRSPAPRRRRAPRSPARHGLGTVVLSGGVFQNRRAARGDRRGAARGAGLRVLVPERLPPNDGGIAYGQAAVAAARDGG